MTALDDIPREIVEALPPFWKAVYEVLKVGEEDESEP